MPIKHLTINGICALLGIDTPEEHWERNIDDCECQTKGEEYWDIGKHEYVLAEKDWTCESCSFDYTGKVEAFFGIVLQKFSLELTKKKDGTYEVHPIISRAWTNAAKELISVINGYGMFYFGSVKEAIASGPYKSAKDFVMSHLGWISTYYEVYEGAKASYRFHQYAFRS